MGIQGQTVGEATASTSNCHSVALHAAQSGGRSHALEPRLPNDTYAKVDPILRLSISRWGMEGDSLSLYQRRRVQSHFITRAPHRTIACTGAGGRVGFKWRVITAGPVMRFVRIERCWHPAQRMNRVLCHALIRWQSGLAVRLLDSATESQCGTTDHTE